MPTAMLSSALGIFLLNPACIRQRNTSKADRCFGREKLALVPLFHQLWQSPYVVLVRVGNDHQIDLARIKRKWSVVLVTKLARTLEDSAVHENFGGPKLDEVARAGHGLRGTMERQRLHARTLRLSHILVRAGTI